jgi:hypothetical protein
MGLIPEAVLMPVEILIPEAVLAPAEIPVKKKIPAPRKMQIPGRTQMKKIINNEWTEIAVLTLLFAVGMMLFSGIK